MSEVCGILTDIKREGRGVYVFPCLTLLGYEADEAPVQKLKQIGYDIGDSDSRHEGVEVKGKSPFHLIRTMAKEFGYSPEKISVIPSPGDRTGLIWTLIVPEDGKGFESIGIVSDLMRESEGEYIIPTSTVFGLTVDEAKQLQAEGLKIADHDRRNEGFEIHGASPFKVMRVLSSKGWTTDSETTETTVAEGKTSIMWTMRRQCK